MSQRIRAQATKFWSVLVGSDTFATYRKAIHVTWQIVKEGMLLVWLVLCFILVGLDWGSERAIAAGRASRIWVDNMEPRDSNQLATDATQRLLAAGKAGAARAVTHARQQLGLPAKADSSASLISDSPMKSAAPPDESTSISESPSPLSSSNPSNPSSPSSPPDSAATDSTAVDSPTSEADAADL